MNRLNFYITATDLVNYLYEPRSVYLMHILKIPQETTRKMEEGKKIHELYSRQSKRNKIIKELPKLEKKYDIYIQSDKLNCATRIDCVLFDSKTKKAFPVEFKYSRTPKRLYDRQVYQLVLEAMLVEEFYGCKVDSGYMKFMIDGRMTKISVTKELKKNLLNILLKIQEIIREEKCPHIKGFNSRLKDYGYRNVV